MTAQRLGDERPRHRRVVQGRRVELHELHVGDRDSRPQRHGDPVAGRLGGLVVTANSCPAPPDASTTWARLDALQPAVGVESHDAACSGRRSTSEIEREPVLENGGRARRATAVTSARSTSAPVAAPPACRTRAIE